MPRYICKFTDDATQRDYYLEWSTVVDAPVTYGMTLEEFTDYYRNEYGRAGEADLEERMKRVEAKGTSSQVDGDVRSLIRGNRAGDKESSMTYNEIVAEYCVT